MWFKRPPQYSYPRNEDGTRSIVAKESTAKRPVNLNTWLSERIDQGIEYLKAFYGWIFDGITHWIRVLLNAVESVFASFAATAAQAQEKVTISDLSWTGAKAIGHVIKAVSDGPLGSEAEIKQGLSDQAIVAEGMDKGDGSVDVYTDMRMPNQRAIWDKYVHADLPGNVGKDIPLRDRIALCSAHAGVPALNQSPWEAPAAIRRGTLTTPPYSAR